MQKSKTVLLALAISLTFGSAIAGTGSINGFGTIGAAANDTSNIRYGNNGTLTDGADFVGESRVGVQADYKINNQWAVTAQAVAKGQDNAQEKLGVNGEWLFASYAATDDAKIRVGKMRLPLFMMSEQLDVGKAYAMAKLPVEMYGMVPTNAYQGVDALLRFDLLDGDLTFQPYAGITRFEGRNTVSADMLNGLQALNVPTGNLSAGKQAYNTFEADSIRGLNVQFTNSDNSLKLRAGAMVTNMDDKGGMTTMMGAFGAGNVAHNVDAQFSSAGFSYKFSTGTEIMAEYGQRRIKSAVFPDTDGYYVMIDHKFGKFTPYLSYASISSDKSKRVSSTQAPIQEQNTKALGVGYELSSTSNVKVEVAQIAIGAANNFNYYAANATTGNALSDTSFNTVRINYNLLF